MLVVHWSKKVCPSSLVQQEPPLSQPELRVDQAAAAPVESNNNNNNKYGGDDSNNPFHLNRRAFRLSLVSHVLFFIASALYIYLAIIHLEYEQEVEPLPLEVLDADDYSAWYDYGYVDDYVFVTPVSKTHISEYTIVYFWAALGFLLAGLVDLYHWHDLISGLMIVAASLGLASASVAETRPTLSIQLNIASVHVWLLDAIAVACFNDNLFGNLKIWFTIANGCFCIGTFTGVVTSWFYLARHPLRAGIPLAICEVIGSGFWITTATIYVVTTLRLGAQAAAVGRECSRQQQQQQQQQQVERTSVGTETKKTYFAFEEFA